MDWKPNIEGVEWFIKNVIPKINKNDKFKIYIAGKKMPKKYLNGKFKNTLVTGKVENALDYISNKEILFVPIFSGSGIRIKILEAMAIGIPVISTQKGAQVFRIKTDMISLLQILPKNSMNSYVF